ncbi:MAG: hypothetical protein WB615_03695 [Candidatus Tumulicola sp.]
MKNFITTVVCATGACAGVAILSACGGTSTNAPLNSQSVAPVGALLARNAGATVRPDRRSSWMARFARRGMLLYGSDFSNNSVDVYSYPKGKLVGTLTGFNQPQGECVDTAGNVFIANTGTSQTLEYAHGGTTPIATFDDSGQYPVSCAVDPTSANLAVANVLSTSGSPGSVSVYKPGKSTPKIFTDKNFSRMYFLAYDAAGNLFVDGTSVSGSFQYAELRKGKQRFADITLGTTIQFPGDVQYDGTYIAIGDQGNANIYQTSGATIVGTTTLGGVNQLSTFFILGKKVLCPGSCNADVAVYAYPAGGAPVKSLSLSQGAPGIVVISQ